MFPGSGTLTITPPAGSGLPAYQVNVQVLDDTTITINLPRSVVVSGKVTLSDGTPLSGQYVSLPGSNAQTNNAGNYSLTVVPGDLYMYVSYGSMPGLGLQFATGLSSAGATGGSGGDGGAPDGGAAIFSYLGYEMSRSVSISGPTTVDAVLPPTRVISGVVLDPDGYAVAGAAVGAGWGWSVGAGGADAGTNPWSVSMNNASTTCDGSGQFRLTVFPGSGTLTITPPASSGLLAYAFPIQAFEDKQIGISIQFVTQTLQAPVQANGTVTTDPGTGPTPADPVTTAVTSPNAGEVSITEHPIVLTPPSGYSFLTQQVNITAPPATTAQPLVLTFILDASRVPQGLSASDIQITRNGEIVLACDGSGTASPDPCVSNRETTADGDVRITVLTSEASAWNFAVHAGDNGTGGAGGAGGSTGGGAAGATGSGNAGGTTTGGGGVEWFGLGGAVGTTSSAGTAGTSGSGDTAGAAGAAGTAGALGSGGTVGTTSSAGTAGASGSGGTAGTAGATGTAGAPGPGGGAGLDGGAGTPGTAGTADAAGFDDSAAPVGEDGSVAYFPSEPDAGSDGSMAEESDAQGAETRTSVDGRETSDVNVDVVFASDAAAPESASDGGANAADGPLAATDGAGNRTSAGSGSGCSCAMAGREHTSALALFWGFAALLLAHRARRRAR